VEAIAEALERGAVAIVPTDTVYGLVCRADRSDAVERIYALKGRPRREPLILFLADATQMDTYTAEVPLSAKRLAAAFWPGPLTMVVGAGAGVPSALLGGGDTVGLRVPDHAALLAIVRRCGTALASTSANRHGAPPPADADAAAAAFDTPPELIVDGGPARHGIPSTVVDCTVSPPRVVRAGAVSEEAVQAALNTP